jgi:hypothetical protein
MGSMFTSGYQRGLEGHLDGLPAGVGDRAREAPGLALDAARELGPRGDALAAAARDAFGSGMRLSMFVGAGLLLAVTAYLAWRGPSRAEALALDELDLEILAAAAPA